MQKLKYISIITELGQCFFKICFHKRLLLKWNNTILIQFKIIPQISQSIHSEVFHQRLIKSCCMFFKEMFIEMLVIFNWVSDFHFWWQKIWLFIMWPIYSKYSRLIFKSDSKSRGSAIILGFRWFFLLLFLKLCM